MLHSSAILLSGGVAGALTAHGFSRTVRASTVETDFDVAGDELTIRDGEIDALWLDLNAEWAYQVPSGESPAEATLLVYAGHGDGELEQVDTVTIDVTFLDEHGEQSLSVDLIGRDVIHPDALVPSEDGETLTTTVDVGLELQVVDESGLLIAADAVQDSATIVVTNDNYDADEFGEVSGDGALTVQLE